VRCGTLLRVLECGLPALQPLLRSRHHAFSGAKRELLRGIRVQTSVTPGFR
jgi:hypothetical protein